MNLRNKIGLWLGTPIFFLVLMIPFQTLSLEAHRTLAKAGLGLNIIGIFLITLIIYLLAIPIFGIVLGNMPTWLN